MNEAIPPLPNMSSCCGAQLNTGEILHLPFTLQTNIHGDRAVWCSSNALNLYTEGTQLGSDVYRGFPQSLQAIAFKEATPVVLRISVTPISVEGIGV
jgi:hypothetical protein